MWGQDFAILIISGNFRIIPTRVETSNIFCAGSKLNQDHPHACGDKENRYGGLQRVLGSSPRVWGQGTNMLLCSSCLRIIPTRVGTSGAILKGVNIPGDHPHACGDKILRLSNSSANTGSSPRVWGQVYYPVNAVCLIRIIPTRVGTSTALSETVTVMEDHPHACGDKIAYVLPYLMVLGSSPRVWGQANRSQSTPHTSTDHPHACGDKFLRFV